MKYNVYSDFDIRRHKETFINYLEVIIDVNGRIMYAVPSHQEKLIAMAMDAQGRTREQLMGICPSRYHFDFMTWLLLVVGAVSVWPGFCVAPAPNQNHIEALRRLYEAGLYTGIIPPPAQVYPTMDELLAPD